MVNQCREPAPVFEISNEQFYKSNELKAIGLLVVQGNFLEHHCREAIIALIAADRKPGEIAISGMNFRTMTQVLKALVYQRLPAQTSRFDRLLKHIETAIDYMLAIHPILVRPLEAKTASGLDTTLLASLSGISRSWRGSRSWLCAIKELAI